MALICYEHEAPSDPGPGRPRAGPRELLLSHRRGRLGPGTALATEDAARRRWLKVDELGGVTVEMFIRNSIIT